MRTGESSATVKKPPATGGGRQVGIDLSRGLAVLLMIQTHAYDGWVSSAGKDSVGYWLSRAVSNIPAPLFLLLAGVGLLLGGQAATRRGQAPEAARRSLIKRGLEVVFYGYLVSAVYSVIEWRFVASALLRADILHCIGLSLALCAALIALRRAIVVRVVVVIVAALGLSLLAGRFVPHMPLAAWQQPLVGLLVDVSPYTRFPLLPLIGFCAAGMIIAPVAAAGGRRPIQYLAWAAAAIALALLFGWLTRFTIAQLGGRLSRSHPAVIWNFLDGTCRALAVLAVGLFLGSTLRDGSFLVAVLVRLGRGSLLAYAVHIPLCYGRLATPIAGKLSMAQATPLVIALMIFTFGIVYLRDRVKQRPTSKAATA